MTLRRRMSRGAITPHGIVAPNSIRVLEGRTYYLGASSSPKRVWISSVDPQVITYFDVDNYTRSSRANTVTRWIGEDLISKGCKTALQDMREAVAKYRQKWVIAEVARLEKILNGQDPGVEDLDDYLRRTVTVVATKPPKGQVTRENDPWYAAEQYGGVSGLVASPWTYEIRCNGRDLRALRKDKRFRIIEEQLA